MSMSLNRIIREIILKHNFKRKINVEKKCFTSFNFKDIDKQNYYLHTIISLLVIIIITSQIRILIISQ